MFVIRNYPLVVDPATNAIEVYTAERRQDREKLIHHQLPRIVPSAEDAPFVQTHRETHIFGNATTLRTCTFFLTYDSAGRLTRMFVLAADKTWVDQDVIPEQAGIGDEFPSVRFVFLNDNDRRQFMRLMAQLGEQIRKTIPPSPRDVTEAILILGRCPEPPRQINVEKLHEQPQPGAA